VIDVARALGLPARVAVLTGDDVLAWVQAHDPALMDAPGRASGLGELVSANAYLGAQAMLPALAALDVARQASRSAARAAEVLITGRVADPALFLAPLMHHFAWPADDWERLGRGILVGHLLECAAQVSGGYVADPGRLDVPDLHDVGFPLAEVAADGSAVITKLPGTGGRVDRLTCTAQLLYEVGDPSRYLQPDVVADFSQVRFSELAAEQGAPRVRAEGAGGSMRPDMLKATVGYRDGWIGEGQISYAGPGAVARGELALKVLDHRLARLGLRGHERRAELIGMNAMHGPRMGHDGGSDREPYEVRLRLALRCRSQDEAQAIGQEVEALYLNGPASGGGVTQSVREVIAAASVLVPRSAVLARVDLLQT
jgi:hypothetical protein